MNNIPEKFDMQIRLSPPEDQELIIRQWGESSQPVVSVCCATYNHVNYLEDAICGILAQKTTFPFEVIIRDDASTDGTAEIARSFARRYPYIVRVVTESENQFRKGIRALHKWPSVVRGEFVALCEGDDFWTDPNKLQKQVELLRKYPEAVMSVAKTLQCRQDGDKLHLIHTIEGCNKILQGFEEINRYYFHTSTYVIRGGVLNEVIKRCFLGHCLFGDTALRAILITYGPFVFLPEVVSVYRETGAGIWTSLDQGSKLQWEINSAEKLTGILTGKHKKYQEKRLFHLYMMVFIARFKTGRYARALMVLLNVARYGVLSVVNRLTSERG